MKIRHSSLLSLCCIALLAGCARNDDATPPGGTPATRPAGMAQGAATEPALSMLEINKKVLWFPPAYLRLKQEDGKVVAELYSESADPIGALTGKETVNSYDLEMVLPDVHDVTNINNAVWKNRSFSMEKQKTAFGIDLNEDKEILQPMDVTVRFQGQAPHISVEIHGRFACFGNSDIPYSPPALVPVDGLLQARVPSNP